MAARPTFSAPSEEGTNVLRIHFARDRRDGAAVIGWTDEYDMCP